MLVRVGTRNLVRGTLARPRNFPFNARTTVVAPSWTLHQPVQSRNLSFWPFGSSTPPPQLPQSRLAPEPVSEPIPTSPVEASATPETVSPLVDTNAVQDAATAFESHITVTSNAVQELLAINPDHTYVVTLMQKLLCNIHDLTHLPWYFTIPLFVVSFRLLLVPQVAETMAKTIKMQKLAPEMNVITRQLQDAQATGDRARMREEQIKLQSLWSKNGVHPFASFKAPVMQMIVAGPLFFALKGLGECTLPSMVTEGALWFTDLSVYDSTYALPAIALSTTLMTIWSGTTEFSTGTAPTPQQKSMVQFMSVLIVASAYWVAYFPAAVTYYFVINNFYSLLQALTFRNSAVRRRFGIPTPFVPPKPGESGYEEPLSLRDRLEGMLERRRQSEISKQQQTLGASRDRAEEEKVAYYKALDQQKLERIQRSRSIVEEDQETPMARKMRLANEKRQAKLKQKK